MGEGLSPEQQAELERIGEEFVNRKAKAIDLWIYGGGSGVCLACILAIVGGPITGWAAYSAIWCFALAIPWLMFELFTLQSDHSDKLVLPYWMRWVKKAGAVFVLLGVTFTIATQSLIAAGVFFVEMNAFTAVFLIALEKFRSQIPGIKSMQRGPHHTDQPMKS